MNFKPLKAKTNKRTKSLSERKVAIRSRPNVELADVTKVKCEFINSSKFVSTQATRDPVIVINFNLLYSLYTRRDLLVVASINSLCAHFRNFPHVVITNNLQLIEVNFAFHLHF